MDVGAWLWFPLENPWPVAIVAVVVGLIARQAFATRRRLLGMRLSWIVALLLAVLVVVAARGITTPREQLLNETRELVYAAGGKAGDAVNAGTVDLATIKSIVDESAMVVGPADEPLAVFRLTVRQLGGIVERYGITGQAIRAIDAEADRGQGVSVVRVSTQSQGGLPPINSAWRLTWRRDVADDRWIVEELQLLEVNNQNPTRGMMP